MKAIYECESGQFMPSMDLKTNALLIKLHVEWRMINDERLEKIVINNWSY